MSCWTLRAATGVASSSPSFSGERGGDEWTYSILRDEDAVGSRTGAGRSFGAPSRGTVDPVRGRSGDCARSSCGGWTGRAVDGRVVLTGIGSNASNGNSS